MQCLRWLWKWRSFPHSFQCNYLHSRTIKLITIAAVALRLLYIELKPYNNSSICYNLFFEIWRWRAVQLVSMAPFVPTKQFYIIHIQDSCKCFMTLYISTCQGMLVWSEMAWPIVTRRLSGRVLHVWKCYL